METIKLDLIPGKKMPSLHASQYDDGREHGIDLFENGVAYKLDGTETLTINERKVDNNICSMDIENTFTGSSHIEFASFLQMCACAGSNFCELRISKDDVDIGTLNFILEVEPDPTADGIESTSEIRNLKTQIEAITEEVIGEDYYTKTQTDEAIATAIEGKADTTYVDTELANKMDKANPTGTGSLSLNRKAGSTVGSNSVAMGTNTRATGTNTTALGNDTLAYGENSVAMGSGCSVSGTNSVAIGNHTKANSNTQFVFGKYNKDDNNNAYAEIVGNGTTAFTKSNARTLDWQGNETLAGDLTYNGNKSLTSEISRLDGRIDNLPAPMIFKGTLGVGGTIQSLPTASASNEGWTYKVITDGSYAGQTAKVGDVFTSNGSAWVYIPSGDEDNDTWRNIKVNGTEVLGNGISSGAVDFEDTANVKFEYDANGNKVRARLDGIYTESDVDDLLDDKADKSDTYTKAQVDDIVYNILPDDTASGSVANFTTSLELPIKSLDVDVNAVQSAGTPTPATPLPISGWSEISLTKCGKNLLNVLPLIDDDYYSLNSDGSLKVLKTDNRGWNSVSVITRLKKGTYTLSRSLASGYCDVRTSLDNYAGGNVMGLSQTSKTFTLSDDADIKVKFGYGLQSGYPFDSFFNISVGSSATTYEPYNGNTEVINLGGTYYGGHFTQDKDGHRQFEVTFEIEDLGNISYSYNSTYSLFTAYLSNAKRTASGKGLYCLCTCFKSNYDIVWSGWANFPNYSVSCGCNYDTSINLVIKDTDYTNATAFKNAMSGIKLVYELATPYVIDLPDGEPIITLNGTNNIYADTGDCAVEYKCSVAEYVANHSGGSGAKSLGGVFLGGSNSGSEEEPTEESEETEKTKEIDEPKEEIKTIGDEPISKK